MHKPYLFIYLFILGHHFFLYFAIISALEEDVGSGNSTKLILGVVSSTKPPLTVYNVSCYRFEIGVQVSQS